MFSHSTSLPLEEDYITLSRVKELWKDSFHDHCLYPSILSNSLGAVGLVDHKVSSRNLTAPEQKKKDMFPTCNLIGMPLVFDITTQKKEFVLDWSMK